MRMRSLGLRNTISMCGYIWLDYILWPDYVIAVAMYSMPVNDPLLITAVYSATRYLVESSLYMKVPIQILTYLRN